ncbi:MAG: DUF1501 domain-containing protein [Planctomycetaceae bacterium]|nr:DUF1501 domain-containing protein [Planctomycetaceae bacterium]
MFSLQLSRRDALRSGIGLTLPTLLQLRAHSASPKRSAKSCIIIYLWGGIAHQESWDPKPHASSDLRGEFKAISTATPGIQFCEHIPLMANHSNKLAVVRSLHHTIGGHGGALYNSITGQRAPEGKAKDRKNWPSITSMLSKFRDSDAGTPRAICMPYLNYDNGALIQGQFGGWLGGKYDPIMMRTPAGKPYGGTSRYTNHELDLKLNMKRERAFHRQGLLNHLERQVGTQSDFSEHNLFRTMAEDMLLSSPVKEAYNLENEDPRIRVMYGDHIGGQSMLLARRLTEAGVPIVQVNAGAGDLAGGGGDNWDTHRDHFPKMKKRLLPVFDRSISALLTDLEQRGSLEETLVAVLTDFGRTPKINNNGGRDHYPAVYSQILAGGGIRGGQVYGSSDVQGAAPHDNPCTPADFHATVYRAMGIDPREELRDAAGRPFQICHGKPLPLF